jgi:poly-gamma-glutamate synthesis protein (capsule biosynthesis protein)
VTVAFSLGNFFSNQTGRYRDSGSILTLGIRKNVETDSVWLNNITFIPTWVYKGSTGSKREFLILPSDYFMKGNTEPFITPLIKNKMKESYEDSRKILQSENAPVNFRTTALSL